MKKLGERLQNLREKNGWNKTYVAKRIGLKTMQTYANYEYGLREPDHATLIRLADLYEVTLDYLIGRSTDPRITAEQERRIDEHTEKTLDILEALNEKDRKELEMMIRVFVEMKKKEMKQEKINKSGD